MWYHKLGLWGTNNPDRIAVSLSPDQPDQIIGHVREDRFAWVAEGDPANIHFATPREAAEHGFRKLWNGRDR